MSEFDIVALVDTLEVSGILVGFDILDNSKPAAADLAGNRIVEKPANYGLEKMRNARDKFWVLLHNGRIFFSHKQSWFHTSRKMILHLESTKLFLGCYCFPEASFLFRFRLKQKFVSGLVECPGNPNHLMKLAYDYPFLAQNQIYIMGGQF